MSDTDPIVAPEQDTHLQLAYFGRYLFWGTLGVLSVGLLVLIA